MKKMMIVCGLLFVACLGAKEFDATEVATLVSGQDRFALALFDELSNPGENTFISPYSIHTALSMTYEGANGATASEMGRVLHVEQDVSVRHNATKSLYDYLMNLGKDCRKKSKRSDTPITISIANGIWIEKTNPLSRPYRTIVTGSYKAQARNVDFQKDSARARASINDWVAGATQQKIKDLFGKDSIIPSTKLVLANAIYFKGLWEKQFDKRFTKDEPFYTEGNQKLTAWLMRMTGEGAVFKYGETDDLQLLEMPYVCGDLSMVILLPKDSNISVLEQKLNKDSLRSWLQQMREQRVDIYIPRFTVSTKYILNEPLKKLGMPLAFSGAADFSGIDGSNSLFISLVVHQAFVEVNEEGTEAAAATGVAMTRATPRRPQEIPVFRADHPFIFVIKENKTGTLLFMGKVIKP
jgi:serpin B